MIQPTSKILTTLSVAFFGLIVTVNLSCAGSSSESGIRSLSSGGSVPVADPNSKPIEESNELTPEEEKELEKQSLSSSPSPITGSWLTCSVSDLVSEKYNISCIIPVSGELDNFELKGWRIKLTLDTGKIFDFELPKKTNENGHSTTDFSIDMNDLESSKEIIIDGEMEYSLNGKESKKSVSITLQTRKFLGYDINIKDGRTKISLRLIKENPDIKFELKDPGSSDYSKIEVRRDFIKGVTCNSGYLMGTFLPIGSETSEKKVLFDGVLEENFYNLSKVANAENKTAVIYKLCYYDQSGNVKFSEEPDPINILQIR